MDWIDKLNKELEERRERNKTPEAKEEAQKRMRKSIASEGGKVGGKVLLKKGKGLFDRTEKQISEDASKAGTISGNIYKGKFLKEWKENNPEEFYKMNSELGKIQGQKNVESGHLDKLHKQYSKENSKYFDHKEKICPNCNKTIKGLGMYSRWHGDNCNELKKIQKQLSIIKDLPEIFTSNDVVRVCKEKNFNNKQIKYGICKNPKYIQVIKVGTNQSNPSIYKKL
jgi:hypothetical protein